MNTLLLGLILVLGMQVLDIVQGWVVMWRTNSLQRRVDALESELKQFRGIAKLQDIPKEQRNGIKKVA